MPKHPDLWPHLVEAPLSDRVKTLLEAQCHYFSEHSGSLQARVLIADKNCLAINAKEFYFEFCFSGHPGFDSNEKLFSVYVVDDLNSDKPFVVWWPYFKGQQREAESFEKLEKLIKRIFVSLTTWRQIERLETIIDELWEDDKRK